MRTDIKSFYQIRAYLQLYKIAYFLVILKYMKTLRQNVLFHKAHDKGMSAYKNFFTKTTDPEIKKVIDKLIQQGEFDNKIFIIVADHGMTQMPTGMTYTDPVDGSIQPAEMSCSLRVSGFNRDDIQEAEKANNNLHIWELGEMLKAVGENGGELFKILTPESIANLYFDKNNNELPYGGTKDKDIANVIAALNGPMTHIYLKAAGGWGDTTGPDTGKLRKLAESIKTYLKDGGADIENESIKQQFKNLLSSVDYILIRENNVYKIFNGLTAGNVTELITETSFDSNYVEAMKRIEGMNSKERSGDIILIMKDSTSSNAIDRYTTGVACKSWHGSLNPSDSYVPFILAYPGGNKNIIENIFKDETETFTAITGCDKTNDTLKCDYNFRLTNIIKKIIEKQY